MNAPAFISSRLKFKSRVSLWATALSSFIMIVAVSVASGYRKTLHASISELVSDVVLTDSAAVRFSSALIAELESVDGVSGVEPVVSCPGIVRSGDEIDGVLFKGVESSSVRIPNRLAQRLSLSEGDDFLACFIEGKLKARKFRVEQIYSPAVELDDALVVYVPISEMRRVLSLDENEATALEVRLEEDFRSREQMMYKSGELGYVSGLYARSSAESYASVFDWMQLVDMNVMVIIVLMCLVAAFNMISGLLIMIMRSTSTIGMLKALGMDNVGVRGLFLRISSRAVLIGLALGNAAALLFCLLQENTHFIKLDPANYFVSYVPVSVSPVHILLADVLAWALVMLLLLIPARQISKVAPAEGIENE